MDEKDRKTIETLIRSIDNVYHNKRQLYIRSFVSGIFYGLGATIGLAIVALLLTLLISALSHIPFIGNYFSYLLGVLHQKPFH